MSSLVARLDRVWYPGFQRNWDERRIVTVGVEAGTAQIESATWHPGVCRCSRNAPHLHHFRDVKSCDAACMVGGDARSVSFR